VLSRLMSRRTYLRRAGSVDWELHPANELRIEEFITSPSSRSQASEFLSVSLNPDGEWVWTVETPHCSWSYVEWKFEVLPEDSLAYAVLCSKYQASLVRKGKRRK
jgi:hypothetical protein